MASFLDLSHILQFATDSAREPVLGFGLAPSLGVILSTEMKVASEEGPSDKQQEGVSEEQHPPVEGGFLP